MYCWRDTAMMMGVMAASDEVCMYITIYGGCGWWAAMALLYRILYDIVRTVYYIDHMRYSTVTARVVSDTE